MKTKNFFLAPALLSIIACSSEAPALGLKNKSLAACPTSPNCVSSMVKKTDETHYIAALKYTKTKKAAYNKLLSHLSTLKNVNIKTTTDAYIYATFTSSIMHFIDDVEFYFPTAEAIFHVRSASRVGHSDMGINRKRIETLRKNLRNDL